MTEDQLEREVLGWLSDVGWQHRYGPDLVPDGPALERDHYRQVVLTGRLRQAVAVLNPNVPAAARDDAVRQVLDLGTPVLLAANRQFHRVLVSGVLMVKRILRKYKYPPDRRRQRWNWCCSRRRHSARHGRRSPAPKRPQRPD